MVKVKLVENSLNSRVGRVMELNVTTQYRIAGTSRARSRARTPRSPSHDRDGLPSCAVANAEGIGDTGLEMVLRKELEPVEPVGASPGKDASMAGLDVGDHAACWAAGRRTRM